MKNNRSHIPSLNRAVLRHFGLSGTGQHDSVTAANVRNQLRSGIEDHQMQALIAPFGSGKTYLFRQLKRQLKDQPIEFVHVKAFEDKWIRIGAILTAMITDLRPQANIRRDIETRSRQIINILGEVVVKEGKRVCLVIEDCHRLHLNTLNSLKLMREEDFAGHAPLFGVMLIGWPEFLAKIENRKDILWRMQINELNKTNGWMLERDRIKYIENVFGEAVTPSTRKRIARMKFTPEAINHYIAEMMKKAFVAGHPRIDDEVVQPELSEIWASLKEQYGNEISLSMVADEAGLGKSTVHTAIEGDQETPATAKVRKAIERVSDQLSSNQLPGNNKQRGAA